MNSSELNSKSIENLNDELKSLLKEQFNLKFQSSLGQLKQTHLIRVARRNIARVKTAINLKKRGVAS